VNSTEDCWSEEPVDTVQFRDEPPGSGSGLAWFKARALGARDREFESPLPDQIWTFGYSELMHADAEKCTLREGPDVF
jgi:hypothetical protein